MKKPVTSQKLFARAAQILPGGVDSPVRAFQAVGGSPLFVRRAAGATIEDVDGNRFIDYVMSWGPLIHGHAPRALLVLRSVAVSHKITDTREPMNAASLRIAAMVLATASGWTLVLAGYVAYTGSWVAGRGVSEGQRQPDGGGSCAGFELSR